MIHAAIIPDSKIIRVRPAVPDLQIMILNNQLREPVQKMLALSLANFVDPLCMMTNGVNAFPARNRIRADDWVDGSEILANVLRSTALGAVELETVVLCALLEDRLRVGARQLFQEFLVGG